MRNWRLAEDERFLFASAVSGNRTRDSAIIMNSTGRKPGRLGIMLLEPHQVYGGYVLPVEQKAELPCLLVDPARPVVQVVYQEIRDDASVAFETDGKVSHNGACNAHVFMVQAEHGAFYLYKQRSVPVIEELHVFHVRRSQPQP